MPRLGTYTTFDCPTDKIDEAFKFLSNAFDDIEGNVHKVFNPHDFGSYPSFEIDYPLHLNNLDEDDETFDNLRLLEELDDWHTKANEIQEKYNKQFADYL